MNSDGGQRAGYFQAVVFPKAWPPTASLRLHQAIIPPDTTLAFQATDNGAITAVLSFASDHSVLCLASPPITFEKQAAGLLLEVTWKDASMRFEINKRDVTDPAASFRLPGQEPDDLGHTLTDPGAYAACAKEVADRVTRYAPAPRKAERTLTLDEEKKALSDLLLSLQDDANAVASGRGHKIRNVRGALRELVVYLGGPSYQPALFRVASRVGAPLPICATQGGRIKEVDRTLEKPHGLGISFGRFGTKIFEPGVLIDLETWMREPVVLDRRAGEIVQRFSIAELVSKAAENLGGAHTGPNVPLTIDLLEKTLQENGSVITHFLMALTEVVLELGAFVLAWQPPQAHTKT